MKIKKYKKTLAVCLFAVFLYLIFIPLVYAWSGIVPCGGPSNDTTGMCTLCHLIVGIKKIFDYAFLIFVGVALLMLVVAGIMYIVSAGSTAMMESAKKLMKSVLAGFALVLLGWLIVNYTMIILSAHTNLGVTGATNWYTFTCNTTSNAVMPSNSGITPVGGGGNTTGGGGTFGGGGAGGSY
jgi:uncharacterized membrane protein YgcG